MRNKIVEDIGKVEKTNAYPFQAGLCHQLFALLHFGLVFAPLIWSH